MDHQDIKRAWLLTRRYRLRFLTILLLTAILNFMDRAILSAAIEPMRRDLHLSDTQIGLLQGLAFGAIYALFGLPVGWLTERVKRTVLLACSTTLFSVMSGLCGLATGFGSFFFLRAGVGIGDAAFMPPTVSMLADHYPAERRASAFSIINLGSPIGYLLGAVVGGRIVGEWGWRAAFLATAVPGLIVALLILFGLHEPPRGLVEGRTTPVPPPPLRTVLSKLVHTPTFLFVVAGASLCLLGSSAIAQFMFPYFVRVQGLSVPQAGLATGLVSFASIGGGSLVGGFGSDWARRFNPRWSMWLPTIGTLIGGGLYSAGFLSHSVQGAALGLTAGGIVGFSFYAPSYATVQNLLPPKMRATAIGVMALVFGLVGVGLGPSVAGLLSDTIARHNFVGGNYGATCFHSAYSATSGCAAASALGLRYTLAILAGCFALASVFFLLASRTMVADVGRAEQLR